MDNERLSTYEIVEEYKESVKINQVYTMDGVQTGGQRVSTSYEGNGVDKISLSIPVYDSTLLE